MDWLQNASHGMLEGEYCFQSFSVHMRGLHLTHSEAIFAVQTVRCGFIHGLPNDMSHVSGFPGEDTGFLELEVTAATADLSR